MNTAPPPQPPYGILIELARKGARLTVQEAADRAGVSKATWIDSVRGWRRRGGVVEHIEPKPETVAHMACAAGVSPGRLEAEGQRPDAAEILREILRPQQPPAAPQDPRSLLPPEPDDAAMELFPDPDDFPARWIWRQAHKSEEQRLREIRGWREAVRQAAAGEDTALPYVTNRSQWVRLRYMRAYSHILRLASPGPPGRRMGGTGPVRAHRRGGTMHPEEEWRQAARDLAAAARAVAAAAGAATALHYDARSRMMRSGADLPAPGAAGQDALVLLHALAVQAGEIRAGLDAAAGALAAATSAAVAAEAVMVSVAGARVPAAAGGQPGAHRRHLRALPAVIAAIAGGFGLARALAGAAGGHTTAVAGAAARRASRAALVASAGSALVAGSAIFAAAPYVTDLPKPALIRAAAPAVQPPARPVPEPGQRHRHHGARHPRPAVPVVPHRARPLRPSPPPPPPAPGVLAVSATRVITDGGYAVITLTAAGGPVAWTLTCTPGIELSRYAGVLAAGARITVTITTTPDRSGTCRYDPGGLDIQVRPPGTQR